MRVPSHMAKQRFEIKRGAEVSVGSFKCSFRFVPSPAGGGFHQPDGILKPLQKRTQVRGGRFFHTEIFGIYRPLN
jgi:hypothetical protein